jgi:Tfp pilus assembly protein PilF
VCSRLLGLVLASLVALICLSGCDRPVNRASQRTVPVIPADASDDLQTSAEPALPIEPGVPENATYVSDSECRDCHESIFESYQDVAMARSFYPFDEADAIESFDRGSRHFYHEASNRHYEMSVEDGVMVVARYRLREDGTQFAERRQRVHYVMGSGNNVRSYFYRNDAGEMFELPVVWYAGESRWGMAPGYDRPHHEGFDRPVTRQCMFCHNAYPTIAPGDDAFGTAHCFPEKLPHGIGCQRCHGPGSAHVRLAHDEDASDETIVSAVVNPARLPTRLAEDVCLQCHLQPTSRRTSVLQRFGKPDYAFQPGLALDDFRVYLELDENTAQTDRFDINHHPYRLHQSACFQKSDGALQCTTCHNPHATVATADRSAYYRQRCLTCHRADDCRDEMQGHKPDADCAHCHMPKRRTQDVVHVAMTEHKIAPYRAIASLTAEVAESALSLDLKLRPYLGDGPVPDDPALKLYALLARARDHSPSAITALRAELHRHPSVAIEPWVQLGQSQVEIGNYTDAVETLEEVLTRDAKNSLAHANLGTALLGLRSYAQAAEHLRVATSLQPNRSESWFNLGLAMAKSGDGESARSAYQRALELRPTYAKCQFNLGNLMARAGQLDEAQKLFERAIELDCDEADAYQNLGATFRARGDWRAAIGALEDGLLSAPSAPLILRDLVITYLGAVDRTERNSARAILLTKQYGQQAKDKTEPALLLALALFADRQWDESVKQVDRALEAGADSKDCALVRLMAQSRTGDAPQRQEIYTRLMAELADRPAGKVRALIKQRASEQFTE